MKQNILIVGVNGGMGSAIAERFLLNENNHVVGLDRQENTNLQAIDYYSVDITDESSIQKVFLRIKNQVEEIHSIIVASGIYLMDSLLEISDESLKKIIDVNALGPQRIIKAFFPLLKKGSKILLITSEVSTLDPLPFNGIYTMSKSLLEKYAFSLRMEVNNFGIKVIVLRPGAVKTSMLGDSTDSLNQMCEKTSIHKDSSKKFKHIVESIESKSIAPIILAKKIYKIINKKKPKYVYRINNNFLLKLLNFLPDRLQVNIISKIIK